MTPQRKLLINVKDQP